MSTFARTARVARNNSQMQLSIDRNAVVTRTSRMNSGASSKSTSEATTPKERCVVGAKDGIKGIIQETVKEKKKKNQEEGVWRNKNQAPCCDDEEKGKLTGLLAGKGKGKGCKCVEMVEMKK